MTGVWLRKTSAVHVCDPPRHAQLGDVWRCGDCQRRWTCYDAIIRGRGQVRVGADWKPRYWPWPK